MLKGIIMFAVIFLFVILGFAFLLRKEYSWIKNCDKDQANGKLIALWLGTIGTAVIGILVIIALGFYMLFSIAMYQEAKEYDKIVNLNAHTEVLHVGDIWDVDGLGNVSIDAITQLSAEDVQTWYGITPEQTNQYYEISFDYENIAFDGYLRDDKVVEDTMLLTVYVNSIDADGNMIAAWLDTVGEQDEYYAMQGESVQDNKFLMIVDEQTDLYGIEVSFTIYTIDRYELYRQVFVYEV